MEKALELITYIVGFTCGEQFETLAAQRHCFSNMTSCIEEQVREVDPESMPEKRVFWAYTKCYKENIKMEVVPPYVPPFDSTL